MKQGYIHLLPYMLRFLAGTRKIVRYHDVTPGSQITWNTQATVGVNFTRNIFGELGYRYMYVDYNKNNFLYQMNSFGLFSSIGVKF